MELESVRNLKAQAKDRLTQFAMSDLSRRQLGVRAQSLKRTSQPRTIALGVAAAGPGDYKLAVRVQHPLLLGGAELEGIRQMAAGEVDMRYIGPVHKLQGWYQQQCRPVRMGGSVAHFQVTAGAVGAFASLGTTATPSALEQSCSGE